MSKSKKAFEPDMSGRKKLLATHSKPALYQNYFYKFYVSMAAAGIKLNEEVFDLWEHSI
jgi:hypothetical protein